MAFQLWEMKWSLLIIHLRPKEKRIKLLAASRKDSEINKLSNNARVKTVHIVIKTQY